MISSPPSQAPANSTYGCDCREDFRSACEGETSYEHESKRYCVLHYPCKEKSQDFNDSLRRKLDNTDLDFSGVWFPDGWPFEKEFGAEVSFRRATFNAFTNFGEAVFSAGADFYGAEFGTGVNFNGAKFHEEANFEYAVFKAEAYFAKATFKVEAVFKEAKFDSDVYFSHATFEKMANFYSAKFTALVYFRYAKFSNELYLRDAYFGGYVIFGGNERSDRILLNLQYAAIEKPSSVSFQKLTLRPHLFANVDARKFEFTRVDWDRRSINEEIESLTNKQVSSPHEVLALSCWYLADNAEENHRYEEASDFRYMAMDTRRREKRRGLTPWRLGWWYWLVSGYGERILRAFMVLMIGVWLLFAVLYTYVGFARWEPRWTSESEVARAQRDEVGSWLAGPRALTYSLGVMTLQKPEPRPATIAAQHLVTLQTILGPLQAALFALAIRRKFMR